MEITQELLRVLALGLHKVVTWRGLQAGGFDEYYYAQDFELYQDDWEPMHISVKKGGTKLLGYNGYIPSNGVRWYGTKEDFFNLWLLISNHDEILQERDSWKNYL